MYAKCNYNTICTLVKINLIENNMFLIVASIWRLLGFWTFPLAGVNKSLYTLVTRLLLTFEGGLYRLMFFIKYASEMFVPIAGLDF